jgi:hypothetical protein
LRSIACGPKKNFFYRALLAMQGYRSTLPSALLLGPLLSLMTLYPMSSQKVVQEKPSLSSSRRAFAGTLLSFFSVGCPVCNKVVVLLLGVGGAMTLFNPLRPFLGLASRSSFLAEARYCSFCFHWSSLAFRDGSLQDSAWAGVPAELADLRGLETGLQNHLQGITVPVAIAHAARRHRDQRILEPCNHPSLRAHVRGARAPLPA